MYRLLQKHSAFRSDQANLVESKVMHALRRREISGARSDNIRKYIVDEAFAERFIKRAQEAGPELDKYRLGASVRKRLQKRSLEAFDLSALKKIMRDFVYFSMRGRGVDRLVEKTPQHFHYLPELINAFEQSYVVCMYRHPVDSYSSYIRRAKVDSNWNAVPSIKEYAAQYRKYDAIVKEAAAASKSVIVVDYERLVSAPQETLKSILEELGEEDQSGPILEDASDSNKTWVPDPYLFSNVTETTKNWKEFLSVSDAANLEYKLRELMTRKRYRFYAAE